MEIEEQTAVIENYTETARRHMELLC